MANKSPSPLGPSSGRDPVVLCAVATLLALAFHQLLISGHGLEFAAIGCLEAVKAVRARS
jgi:hypothetical protein